MESKINICWKFLKHSIFIGHNEDIKATSIKKCDIEIIGQKQKEAPKAKLNLWVKKNV